MAAPGAALRCRLLDRTVYLCDPVIDEGLMELSVAMSHCVARRWRSQSALTGLAGECYVVIYENRFDLLRFAMHPTLGKIGVRIGSLLQLIHASENVMLFRRVA